MYKALSLMACLALAACGDVASKDSGAFSFNFKDGQMNGTYNPEGRDAVKIQKFIQVDCPSKKLTTYNETPQTNGLIAFVANCA
jgi:hypothetical protein